MTAFQEQKNLIMGMQRMTQMTGLRRRPSPHKSLKKPVGMHTNICFC